MAVPKTIATRCRDGSMQARYVIYKDYMSNPPSISFKPDIILWAML